MAKKFDNEALSKIIIGVVADTFKQMCHVSFTAEPVAVEKDIIEYDGKMRLFPMEKFNGPAYIGIINYYISQKDLEAKNAVGTFTLFVKEDIIERLVRAFGRPVAEAEDEAVVLDIVGEMSNILGGNVKNEFRNMDCIDLTLSAPFKYKNVVPEGAQFDYGLYKKQEIAFSFWNQKCIVIEACVGMVPHKSHG